MKSVLWARYLTSNAHRPMSHLGREKGVTRERIRQLYKLLQIPRRVRSPGYNSGFTRERVEEILKESPLITLTELATLFAVRKNYLRTLLRKAGLKIPALYKRLADRRLRRCSSCKTIKNFEEFHRDSSDPCGFQRRCRDCQREAMKQSYRNRLTGVDTLG